MANLNNSSSAQSTEVSQSSADLNSETIDIRKIGASKNSEMAQGVRQIAQLVNDAKEAIQDRLNAVVGFATVQLDRTNFSEEVRQTVRQNAINGFKENINDAAATVSQAFEDKIANPIQDIIKAKIIGPTQAAVENNIIKPVQDTVKQVSESLEAIKKSFQQQKSAERKEMVREFTEERLEKAESLVSQFEVVHQDEANKAIEKSKSAIEQRIEQLGDGVISKKDRLDAQNDIKNELAKLNSELTGIQCHDVFDKRADEFDKKLEERADVSGETKGLVEVVRDTYLRKMENQLREKEQEGDYLGQSDLQEVAKIVSEMEKDVNRRVAALNRMEKLEEAAQNLGDMKATSALQEARKEFANQTADGEFSTEEAAKIEELLNGVRDGLVKQQVAQGVVALAETVVNKLKDFSAAAATDTSAQTEKLATGLKKNP